MKLPKLSLRLTSSFEWLLILGLVLTIVTVWKYETPSAHKRMSQYQHHYKFDALANSLLDTKPSNEHNMELNKVLVKSSRIGIYNGDPNNPQYRKNYETVQLPEKATKNIYFLKVHKTGSTTIYNMLCRFAWKYDLRAATYGKRPFGWKRNSTLMSFLVPVFTEGESEKFNVAFEHSQYEPEVINKILYDPTTHLTMLRHPITWLDSFLHYERLIFPLELDKHHAVASFVSKLNDTLWLQSNHIWLNRIRTWMSDLAFNIDPKDRGSEKAFIELGKVFLVGIHERYDETLILMRRRFNWSFQDVLYAPLRKQSYNRTAPNKALYNQLCAWMPNECRLYEFFNRTLEESIKKEGYKMTQEVMYFKMVLKRIAHFCYSLFEKVANKEKFDSLTGLKFSANSFHGPFTYTYMDCALSRFDEYIYRPLFFYRQNPEFGFLNQCPVMRDHHNMCPKVGKLFFNSSNVIEDIMSDPAAYLWQ